jgi:16S rRNA (guanine527-N7)-methyltransferase
VTAPPPPELARNVFADRLAIVERYVELLATEGVVRGLLGPRETERIWARHVLNSAAVAPLIGSAARVVDVGSGAGLPGIPLALARPDLEMWLLEPMRRRADFLQEVVDTLGLNVQVRMERAEVAADAGADVVVARAVAPLTRLVPLTMPLLRREGLLVAIKGASAAAELRSAAHELQRWCGDDFRLEHLGVAPADATVVVAARHR